MLGNFSCLCCHLLTLQNYFFQNNSYRNTIRVLNSFDPDPDRHVSVLIWFQTVYKGNHQTTKITTIKEIVNYVLRREKWPLARKELIMYLFNFSCCYSSNWSCWRATLDSCCRKYCCLHRETEAGCHLQRSTSTADE